MKPKKVAKAKAGRKLTRLESPDVAVCLINDALDLPNMGTLAAVADAISYRYTAMWSVYHGERPMPALPFLRLCTLLGKTEKEAIKALEALRVTSG